MINRAETDNVSDEELVRLSLINDEYFSCLISRYDKRLMAYIFRISSFAKEEAEDILQEIFIKVYKNLRGFERSLKFSSWIYRIAHNETITHYRRQKSKPQTVNYNINDEVFDKFVSGIRTDRELDQEFVRKNINAALSGMDIKYREVIILRYLEERDYNEISDILKKPRNTVATLINRAKRKLFEEFKKREITF